MNTPTTPPTPRRPGDPGDPGHPGHPDLATAADPTATAPSPTRSSSTTPPPGPSRRSSATSATATPDGGRHAASRHGRPRPPRPTTAATEPPEQEWLKGPAPFALVLGLLGLVVAGATLLSELADVNVPWDDLGPWSVVAAGIVVLLVGAIGLRSSRARS